MYKWRMAILTGHSWCVLNSWWTCGAQNKDLCKSCRWTWPEPGFSFVCGAGWSTMNDFLSLPEFLSLKGLCFGCVLFPYTKGNLMKSLLPTLGSNPSWRWQCWLRQYNGVLRETYGLSLNKFLSTLLVIGTDDKTTGYSIELNLINRLAWQWGILSLFRGMPPFSAWQCKFHLWWKLKTSTQRSSLAGFITLLCS